MNRETPDEDAIPLPPHGRPPALENRMPCRRCGTQTLVGTLNHYGARCFRCYGEYCTEPQQRPMFEADKRVGGPKAWAHALRAREEAGERLSLAQRTMWREAIGLPITGAIPSWEQTQEEFDNGLPSRREAA